MILCDSLRKCEFHPHDEIVIAMGVFDGLHEAHQFIIQECKKRAEKRNGKSLIFTFQNHPATVVAPDKAPHLLTPYPLKRRLIERMDIDFLMAVPFDLELSRISAKDFIEEVLIHQLNAKEIVVGFNFCFGFQREGKPPMLKEYIPKYFDDVLVVERQEEDDRLVSSTLVRQLVDQGNLSRVEKILQRPYQIAGQVIAGDGRGRTIGIPTANLDTQNQVLPPSGVYGVRVCIDELDNKPHWGVMNIGRVPTFTELKQRRVEIHLLDTEIDLYGRYLIADILCHLRDEMKFSGKEELIQQIHNDINSFKKHLTQKQFNLYPDYTLIIDLHPER